MGKRKIINGVRVLPLFYEKQYFRLFFFVAMMGLTGAAISMVIFVIDDHDSTKNISEMNVWEALVLSLFLFAISLPISALLYFSHTIVRILETLAENSKKGES